MLELRYAQMKQIATLQMLSILVPSCLFQSFQRPSLFLHLETITYVDRREGALFYKPHYHPNGFYWGGGVTNAQGPSPQPTACRSPSCSLTTQQEVTKPKARSVSNANCCQNKQGHFCLKIPLTKTI